MAKDPADARAEYTPNFARISKLSSIAPYQTSERAWPHRISAIPGVEYYAFVDPAGGSAEIA